MKRVFGFLVLFSLIFVSSLISAESCYVCSPWSECNENNIRTRTCEAVYSEGENCIKPVETLSCDQSNLACKDSDTPDEYNPESIYGDEPYKKGHLINEKQNADYYDHCTDLKSTDLSKGYNITTEGKFMVEYYCNGNNYQYHAVECPLGCREGTCINPCKDTDGGDNYYELGKTYLDYSGKDQIAESEKNIDFCETKYQLREYTCKEDAAGISSSIFICENGCNDGKCINSKENNEETRTEQVACVFTNTDARQNCYTTDEKYDCFTDQEKAEGTGDRTDGSLYCINKVSGEFEYDKDGPGKAEKLTWKSSCGGYAYTQTDGDDETITFDCKAGESNEEQIKGNAFRFAYWQCYNGEEFKAEEKSSCKTSTTWQRYAKEFCEDQCSPEKCGVQTFSVSVDCYSDEKITEDTTKEETKEKKIFEDALVCKDSCPFDGKCYPFGYRKEGKFCSEIGAFVNQNEAEVMCENNFECSSNVCVSNKCISQGFLDKIFSWFRNLFGSE